MLCNGTKAARLANRKHAGRIGCVGANDVESRSVSNACAHQRQAERDIHGPVHAQKLDGDVSLVMVQRDDSVKIAAAGP